MATMTTTSPVNATASIAKTLGVGSGVDLAALVAGLVDAQYANKTAQLTNRADTLTAQISGVAKLKSGITGFSNALATLAQGGTLATSVASSNAGVLKATALPGASVAGLTAAITVDQLAAAQSLTTNATRMKRTDTVGTGTLTISFGSETDGDRASFAPSGTTFAIEITAADQTFEGIAKKINAANRGLAASVVTDASGNARMVIKGPTGASRAFRIDTPDPALAFLDTDTPDPTTPEAGASRGPTLSGTAQDAELTVDGIPVTRSTNSIADLVEGVRLDLVASSETAVTFSTTPPTAALSQSVTDLAGAFNELLAVLKAETDPATGSLARDPAAAAMRRSMAALTLAPLVPDAPAGAPRTLAEIGVGTNRDGTLKVDAVALARALNQWPGVVEEMFAPGKGLPAALAGIAAQVTDATSGLEAATTRYTKAQDTLTDEQTRAGEQAENTRTRMTRQFAAMDARVAAYKSTQAFLTQQIDAWNNSDN